MKALLAAAAALLCALRPATASAQDAWKRDAFAGYSLLSGEGQALHGWHAAFGLGLSGRIGLLLDASGHQGSMEGTDLSTLSLMAGPRLAFGGGRVRPFVHVIGGVVRTKEGIRVFDVEITESASDFGGAAGGGLDLGFGERWGLRLAGDYRVLAVDGGTATDPRFSAGVVYRFGPR